ncbi:MAG: DUF4301 family protein [Spirosomataceae bacterium]
MQFSEQDLQQIAAQGIDLQTIEQQIEDFKKGFPFLPLSKAATVGDGILRLSDTQVAHYVEVFESQKDNVSLLKFVPASGAATRMFKSLFSFLEAGKTDKSVEQFFDRLSDFAFYADLMALVPTDADHTTLADYFLTDKGLGYGSLPKGLLKFHTYDDGTRTSVEEHLVEGANYANSKGNVNLHFTVSPEHRSKFNELISSVLEHYESLFGVKFHVSFSEQKSATDTIAVNMDNTPFREKDGSLHFRPAGHGALLANLNDIDADVVFIKNIDNVVPDRIKATTIAYKKALAGVLLHYQGRIKQYLDMLADGYVNDSFIRELEHFFEKELCVAAPEGFAALSQREKQEYFHDKLNRPVRVCGVVPNTGEPGGGPFWANNADDTSSLQIVESAQVDMGDEAQKSIFMNSTHFNPVDLICGLKNGKGEKFDLLRYRDPKTGFITQKSKDGKDLKAQELPGLWNGSMADWNTIFVEVPLITFNPVKTVNDLLRPEHQ